MNYKKVLEKLGFIEGVSFALVADSFQMVEQSRMIPQIINHPEVQEVLDVDGVTVLTPYSAAYVETVMIHHDAVPAVLDVDGVTVLTPEVPAYDEVSLVQELFTEVAPTQEVLDLTWKQVQVSEEDISLLINEYLLGKELLRDYENDSLNTVNNQIYSWSFANIPQPTVDDFLALINPMKARIAKEALVKTLKESGKKDREMCENVLNLIGGFNRTRILTNEQITQMQSTFSTIQLLLQASRPSSAKALIQAIVPDDVLVTIEMKNLILEELAEA